MVVGRGPDAVESCTVLVDPGLVKSRTDDEAVAVDGEELSSDRSFGVCSAEVDDGVLGEFSDDEGGFCEDVAGFATVGTLDGETLADAPVPTGKFCRR